MSLTTTFYPTSGFTTPAFPAYNDQSHLVTSTNSTRAGFRVISDVFVNDAKYATLSCYPFDSVVQVNPQINQNSLLHTFNYDLVGAINNTDSFKRMNMKLGEEYSRVVSYSSITSASSYYYNTVVLNFTTTHNLEQDDRLYIVQDNQSINQPYNNYWKVLSAYTTSVMIDCPYTYTQAQESGIVYEGVEFYDYSYNSEGRLAITTSNNHYFNSGDTVTLAMDGYSTAIVQLYSGNTGGVSGIYVDGVNILTGTIPFNTDLSTSASDIAYAINNYYSTPDYKAYNYPASSLIHIYSFRTSGTSSNGYAVSADTTGTMYVNTSPSMFVNHTTSLTQGWNPQFSNTYTVDEVTGDNSFTLTSTMIDGYDNEPGSQRGSIISSNNYVFSATTSTPEYYINDASNLYEFNDYARTISGFSAGQSSGLFLTQKPRTNNYYYNLNEIGTLDILFNSAFPVSGNNIEYLSVKCYSGDGTSQVYNINVSAITNSYSADTYWRKLSFGVGAWNLNLTPSMNITTHVVGQVINYPIITENTTLYNVRLFNKTKTDISETYTFTRDCNANNKYHQIIFLNKFGAYDYFPVTGNYSKSLVVNRNTFQKKRPYVKSSSEYGIDVDSRGNTVYNIDSMKKIKLYSNWLTLDECEWLQQVYESPDVYLYCPTEGNSSTVDLNVLYPINLLDSEIVLPNERSRMRRFEWTAEISNKRINQTN